MAFKFKVKKRPNLAQAVTSAFVQGATRGQQNALQQMIKDREELKQQSTKELNTFNNLAAGLVQTPKNRQAIINGRLAVMKGSPALETFEAIGINDLDYQTEKEKEDAIAKESEAITKESEALKPLVATTEREAMKFAGMLQPKPTEKEVEVREQKADIRLGLTSENAQKNAYNKVTKERVFATNVEIANNPDLVPISAAPKEVTKKQPTATSLQKSIKNLQDQLNPIRRSISGFSPLSQEEKLQKQELLDKLIKRSTEMSLGNETMPTTIKEKIEF
jgi:hypothetical protein